MREHLVFPEHALLARDARRELAIASSFVLGRHGGP